MSTLFLCKLVMRNKDKEKASFWSNQKTIKIEFVASPLSTQQKEHRLARLE